MSDYHLNRQKFGRILGEDSGCQQEVVEGTTYFPGS